MPIDNMLTEVAGVVKDPAGLWNPLKFVTSVKFMASTAKFVNNIVFIYDPNWTYGTTGESTLPISFLYVRNWAEQSDAEISQKPMMFYNSQKVANTSSVQGGVMNVVADNNIIKPKVYKLEVLVPFMPSQITENASIDGQTFGEVNTFIFQEATDRINTFWYSESQNTKEARETIHTAVNATLGTLNALVGIGTRLLKLLIDALSIDTSGVNIAQLLTQQSEINKLSLDCMRDNRGIVWLKMWNGWKYKYVMIKNLELKKSGEFERFYEGSLTVQEVPIMCVSLKGTEVKKALTEQPLLFSLMKNVKASVQQFIQNNEKKEAAKK